MNTPSTPKTRNVAPRRSAQRSARATKAWIKGVRASRQRSTRDTNNIEHFSISIYAPKHSSDLETGRHSSVSMASINFDIYCQPLPASYLLLRAGSAMITILIEAVWKKLCGKLATAMPEPATWNVRLGQHLIHQMQSVSKINRIRHVVGIMLEWNWDHSLIKGIICIFLKR